MTVTENLNTQETRKQTKSKGLSVKMPRFCCCFALGIFKCIIQLTFEEKEQTERRWISTTYQLQKQTENATWCNQLLRTQWVTLAV